MESVPHMIKTIKLLSRFPKPFHLYQIKHAHKSKVKIRQEANRTNLSLK